MATIEPSTRDPRRTTRRGKAFWIRAGLGVVLLLLAAVYLIPTRLAERAVAMGQGQLAVTLARHLPAADALLAEQLAAARRFDDADEVAQVALDHDPLNVSALRVRGIVAQNKKDVKSARSLFGVGGTLSWRDTPTQFWLLADDASNGDYDRMMQHADALYRRGQSPILLLNVVAQVIADPDAYPALLAKFETNPGLRHDVLWRMGESDSALRPKIYPFLDYLAAHGRPADADELAPLMRRLVDDGDADAAYVVWRRRAGAARAAASAHGNLLNDGALSVAASSVGRPVPPFAWSQTGDTRVQVYHRAHDLDGQGRGLLVQIEEGLPLDVLQQTLLLDPGHYRFTGAVQHDSNGAPQIKVTCQRTGAVVADLEAELASARGARRFTTVVDIPAGCRPQIVTIANGLSDNGSTPASFWLADLALRRF